MTTAEPETQGIPERSALPRELTWDLEALYPAPSDWESDFQQIDGLLEPVLALKGRLDGPAAIAELFAAEDRLFRLVERVYVYAHLVEDQDTKNSESQARMQRIRAKYAQVAGQIAWTEPEILARDLDTLQAWGRSPELADYAYTMAKLIRRKPHTLSDKEETLLSKASEVFSVPSTTFGMLTNADLTFPDVEDAAGRKHPLSNGRFIAMMESKDRTLRRRAFETFYDQYIGLQNTLSCTLAGSTKLHNFQAGVRGYGSALEASLHADNIPVTVFDALVGAVNDALPLLHDYIGLRKEVLGLDDMDMWDIYVPIVPDYELQVGWEQARDWVVEACEPLGEEYGTALRDAFTQRWIDVYENKGKRSGAYSSGCFDSYPYLLLNHQETLDSAFTLAHELGHSLHTWFAKKNQPYRYADYTIFVAEIASTTNEMLLLHMLKERAEDPRLRAFLLNHLCDSFRTTVFRQVQFAEFERMVHEMDARGEPLTGEALGNAYYDLNRRYYGDGFQPDRRIANEWSRIPHFYYNFYVYKYATGFCAAQVFSRRVRESAGQRDAYLEMLAAGGSADPLDIVRIGGVDLADKAVLDGAFAIFGDATKELRGLLRG